MRATVIHGAGDVRVEEVPDPSIQEPADAIVRVRSSCICGSDLWPYQSMPPSPDGQRIGHAAPGPPSPPPLIRRLGADPQAPGHLHRLNPLLEHLRGLQPQPLAAGPTLSGQPAAIGIPHTSYLIPPA